MRSGALALACGLFAVQAAAQPLSADRPGVSNPPNVVAPGELQLETGVHFERETHGDDPNSGAWMLPRPALRVGVLSFLELRASADGLVLETRSGADDRASGSDLSVGSRARAFDQAGLRPAAALDFDLSLPTGSNAVTSDGVDPRGTILLEWSWAERFTLDVNVGLGSASLGPGDSRRSFQVAPSASFDVSLAPRVDAFVEYFATFNERVLDDQHALDAGFAWLVADDLQLDVSGGAGLSEAAPDFFVAAGCAWRFSLR